MLLLSNSLGTSMGMWDAQLPAFATRFRVLRYDGRGHGRSGVPGGAYGLDRLGRDVLELLDALGVARVSFCGLSMGGMIGQWLGARAPERLDRMVLANTSAFMGPPSGWDSRIATVLEHGMGAVADAVLERWFTPAFLETGKAAAEAPRRMLLDTSPIGYAGCCAAIRDMDMRPAGRLIATSTLVIGGSLDPATPPPHSEALAATLQEARIVMLPAAHLSNVEMPEAFTGAALRFLTE